MTLDKLYTKLYQTRRDYYFGIYGMRTQKALIRKMKRTRKEIRRIERKTPTKTISYEQYNSKASKAGARNSKQAL